MSSYQFVNGVTDQRMLNAMELFPQIHDALIADFKSRDIPLNEMIAAFACQRKGGIYAQDNMARVVKNFGGQYSMVRLTYNDGNEQVVVRREGAMPRSVRSFEENPNLLRCTDLNGVRYFQKHFDRVKKKIVKLQNY